MGLEGAIRDALRVALAMLRPADGHERAVDSGRARQAGKALLSQLLPLKPIAQMHSPSTGL